MKRIVSFFAMVALLAISSRAAYYIVGAEPFGNWDITSGMELTPNSDGTYGCKVNINSSTWFVFADGLADSPDDWVTFNTQYRIGPVSGADEMVTAGWDWIPVKKQNSDGAFCFNGWGEYVITLDPIAAQFKIEPVPDFEPDVYTVVGTPEAVFGTVWDNDNDSNDMTWNRVSGCYELEKNGCELAAGTEIQYKIVKNHYWGTTWPEENLVYRIERSGIYSLKFTFDARALKCDITVTGFTPYLRGDVNEDGEVNIADVNAIIDIILTR